MTSTPPTIAALEPRDEAGHQFVLYSDSTSGEPEGAHEKRHALVIAVIRRLAPSPEFISYPGDAVMRGSSREQWKHWLDIEMAWARDSNLPIYQATSNHNVIDAKSVEVYREFWPDTLSNGPTDTQGLEYSVRRGNLLYVCTHQPNAISDDRLGRDPAHLEWLDQTLKEHADAEFKLVAGHYPVFPVNGYLQAPLWCFPEPERAPFWNVLRHHSVTAYLCSHIIAFDFQVHDGIPQITSGGGGTDYLMPNATEYLHATQISVDRDGLRYQVIDTDGGIPEDGAWPLSEGDVDWTPASTVVVAEHFATSIVLIALREVGSLWDLEQDGMGPGAFRPDVHWLASDDGRFALGVEASSGRFFVDLDLDRFGTQRWYGPPHGFCHTYTARPANIGLEVALHPKLGPGGILARRHDKTDWSSMFSSSAAGLECFTWPSALVTQSELVALRYATIVLP